ncbi:FimV/HubP family polar landmark protein [Methylovulum sp.]|uniref:FimV/HubP family polar landmark protein n=1 Tax=Methylovulum sp. TaxID=1916980 RepID=UPI002608E0A3|nr:FimV/HubP family polar landmark protein [Methylovulum sp.]MDD5125782.1 fimbrial protein FimV [Methylovulum sp.]
MRNLTKTIAVAFLLVPASAYPLGIGEIKLHSALNQNLDAEIALLLSSGEKAADIKVNLASPDKFDETGIPWSYFLSKLRFQTIESNSKRLVIKITSREVLKEPFLDFLLQVSWPKGDLYREFTVLVDPPAEYGQAVAPVSEPVDSYEPEPQYRPSVQKSSKPRARVSASLSSERYGPTVKNDTLEKIAGRIGGDGVSMEQLMVALYDANQGAFYKANINALLPDKTLKIPNKEEILKLSQSDALDEFNRQMRAWKNPSSVARVVAGPEEKSENQLTLSAPAQDSVSDDAAVASPNQAVNEASPQTPSLSPDKVKKELTDRTADEAILSKISALEKQLATMQELIALKDQQLAALQNQAQPKPVQPQVSPPVTEPVSPPQPATNQPQPVQPPVVQGPSPTGDVALPNKQEAQPEPRQQPALAKPPVRRIVSPAPEESTSLWAYLGYGVVGIGLLAFLGWFWQQRRKNDYESLLKSSGVGSRSVSVGQLADSDQEIRIDNVDAISSDNLFVSDFNSGEFDVFDMDQAEIDPISEADVYLAYGRYQQAEDLMRHAIKEQPNRDEFKLKLLEIFYANENKQDFEKYTAELIDEGKIDDIAFWSKVTEMGGEICPDSIFFASKTVPIDLKKNALGGDGLTSNGPAGGESKLDEMDFDLASFEELFYSDDSSNPADRLFDLDLDKDITAKTKQPVNDKTQSDQNNDGIDFDLDALAFETPSLEPANGTVGVSIEKPSSSDSKEELETFNFDLSAADVETKKPNADLGETLAQGGSDFTALDFDFSSIEADLDDDNKIEIEAVKPKNLENVDESIGVLDLSANIETKNDLFKDDSLSINFDITKPSLGFAEKDRSESFGLTNLAEMDEMETKLDLAMAYIDMGDRDAANEIAREVLEKGTNEQQLVAKALLENLQ